MRAAGVMTFGEGDDAALRSVEVSSGAVVRTTISTADGRRVETLPPTADRNVRYYFSQIEAANRRIARATALVHPIERGAPWTPVPLLTALIADRPDEPILCPACGGGDDARCVLCDGAGSVLPAEALRWWEERSTLE